MPIGRGVSDSYNSAYRSRRMKNMRPFPIRRPKKRSLLQRLQLDGFAELSRAKRKSSQIFWTTIIILFYFAAIYLSILTFYRYHIGKRVVSFRNQPTMDNRLFFPQISLCHTASWNKTFLEESVHIPDHVIAKAREIGLSRMELLTEFSKYIGYYVPMNSYEMTPAVWDLLTEVYEHNFKGDTHFADFVSDAAFRSKEVFSSCSYNRHRYKCNPARMTLNSPSCYIVPAHPKGDSAYYDGFTALEADKAVLTIESNLPIRHIMNTSADEDPKHNGFKLLFGSTPSTFAATLAIPSNTHAIVIFHDVTRELNSNCNDAIELIEPFHWWYTYETCLTANLEMAAKNVCSCHFVAGNYYPRNDVVCTPRMVKECVQPKVLYPLYSDLEKSLTMKNGCQRRCVQSVPVASATFYNLDHSDDTLRMVLTIRPDMDKRILQYEHDLCHSYAVFSHLGAIISAYTGLSCAALSRVITILGCAGLLAMNLKMVKPLLAKLVGRTPLSVLWERPDPTQWRTRAFVVKRSIRVHPMTTTRV